MNMNAYLYYKLLDTDLDNELNNKNQTILKTNIGFKDKNINKIVHDMDPSKY